jgi:hypothetical protein
VISLKVKLLVKITKQTFVQTADLLEDLSGTHHDMNLCNTKTIVIPPFFQLRTFVRSGALRQNAQNKWAPGNVLLPTHGGKLELALERLSKFFVSYALELNIFVTGE